MAPLQSQALKNTLTALYVAKGKIDKAPRAAESIGVGGMISGSKIVVFQTGLIGHKIW